MSLTYRLKYAGDIDSLIVLTLLDEGVHGVVVLVSKGRGEGGAAA